MFWCVSKRSILRATVCILLVLVSACAVFWLTPRIEGDGTEYLLMQESLKNHLSPEFAAIDRITYRELIQSKSLYSTSVQWWFERILLDNIDAGQPTAGGYIKCKDGAYHCFHFWAYSLFSLPFRVIGDWMGLEVGYSFGMLHALLLACAVWMISRSRCFSYWERCGLAAGLLFICTVFYFNWIHPELFSTVFLAMAIISFLDRRSAMALVLAAIASLQNQPIALALPLFYLAHGFQNPDARNYVIRFLFPFTRWRQWILTILAALIVLLPSFYYLRVYGHPNPIAALGGLSSRWITLSRMFSLWFDINQGIVVGYLGLVIGVLILLPLAILRIKREQSGNLWRAVLLIVLSLLISIPCLTQGNWNAGCAGMLRYGFWIGIPLLFIVVLLLRQVGNRLKKIILMLVIVLQCSVPAYCGYPARTFYLRLNPLSKWIISQYPELYNPDPEIFAERVSRKEGVIQQRNVFVWKTHGRVKKILSRNNPLDPSNFWGEKEFYREVSPSSTAMQRNGWSYLNGTFLILQSGQYTIRYDDPSVEWQNWSVVEPGFRWSLGQESAIRFPIPLQKGTTLSGLVRIRLRGQGNKQDVEIYLNGKKLFGRTVLGFEALTLKYQPDWIRSDEPNEVIFKVPNAKMPPPNGDRRILGVKLMDITFQTISDE